MMPLPFHWLNTNKINLRLFSLIGALLVLSIATVAQQLEHITAKHINPEVRKTTLLVIKYEPHKADDFKFRGNKVPEDEIEKFLEKENNRLAKLNNQLVGILKKYDYPFLLIQAKDLTSFPNKDRYRFILDHSIVKFEGNNILNSFKDGFTYSYYFTDRQTDKKFQEINLYFPSDGKAEKIIVLELNDFLAEAERKEQEELLKDQ